MRTVTLGNTGIVVPQQSFGALPIQRVDDEYAVRLLNKAFDNGMRFFDTARMYTDSERKLGLAFRDIRDKVYIATKTGATTVDSFWADLETSLYNLQTDYVDIYQFHNPAFCPKPNDGTGLYEAMLEAKSVGKVRHIGVTNHRLNVATEAVLSGLYETLQFPFCYLASAEDLKLVTLCKENNVGFIAMKALSGGLITNARAACAWISQFDNVLPIWGVQKETELDEFLGYLRNPPVLDEPLQLEIDKDKAELSGSFCRACGYCMPCPMGIQINNCARMSQLIRRSPSKQWLTESNKEMMLNINNCIECGSCTSRCPYELDTPKLLKQNLIDYINILNGETLI